MNKLKSHNQSVSKQGYFCLQCFQYKVQTLLAVSWSFASVFSKAEETYSSLTSCNFVSCKCFCVVSSSWVLVCRSDLHWSSSFLLSTNNSVTYTWYIKQFFLRIRKMLITLEKQNKFFKCKNCNSLLDWLEYFLMASGFFLESLFKIEIMWWC